MLQYHIPNAQPDPQGNFQGAVTYVLLTFSSYVVISIELPSIYYAQDLAL